MKNTLSKIKKFFAHFFTLDDSAHNIAGGTALGIFLGILPGEGLATTLIAAAILKLNKASATAGVLTTNMWGTVVTLPLATIVGGFFFGESPNHLSEQFYQTYHLGFKFFLSKAIFFDLALPLIIGFIISAGIISLAFYFIIFFLLKYKKIVNY
ncbi:MAG TPA: hypothetical protein DDY21_02020 [Candidatus Moranbacteria bacterium]|nr:hypothetical protein [Candidatus Moranbacteria bacterium]HCO99824.1 hypothetical protein [Candidatus Moranbacteria bacterium]